MDLQLFAEEAAEAVEASAAPEAAGQEAAPEVAVEAAAEAAAEAEQAAQSGIWEHLRSLERQGEELRRQVPGFDLRSELENPVFLRLTAPGVGVSVADAYYVVHRRELQEAAERKMANAIRAGSLRPRENGINNQAPAVTTFDYRRASKEQRNALKAYIRSEAARGRKVYPG